MSDLGTGFVISGDAAPFVDASEKAAQAAKLMGDAILDASAATRRAAAQIVTASDDVARAKAQERLALSLVTDALIAQAREAGVAAKAIAQAASEEAAAMSAPLEVMQRQAAAWESAQAAEAASTEALRAKVTASFTAMDTAALGNARAWEESATRVQAAQDAEAEHTGRLAGTLSAVGSTSALALAAIGTESVKSAVTFQQSTELLRTSAGATQPQVDQLRQGILALATQTGTGPNSLAEAMHAVVSVGYRGQDALNVMRQAALGAKAGNSDLSDTTDALAAAMKALNAPASDAGKTMGELVAIVGGGNMHLDDLTKALGTGVVPAVGAAGVGLQSLGAGLDFLTDRGTSAESAAQRIRQEVALIESPSDRAAKALGAIGLQGPAVKASTQAMADALAKAHVTTLALADDLKKPDGLQVALVDLRQHLLSAGLGADAANALIGKAFGGGKSDTAVIEMSQNMDGLKQKYDQIGKTSDNFGNSVAATQQTAAYQYAQMKADVEAVGISLGQKLLPPLEQVGHWLTEGSNATTVLAIGLGALTAATVAWTVSLLANPVVLVTAAVIGLGVGLYEAYEHSATFRNGVKEAFADVQKAAQDVARVSVQVWHTVSDALQTAAAAVVQFLQPAFALAQQISQDFQQFWAQHGQEIEQIASAAWGAIKTIITDSINISWSVIKPVLAAIESVFKTTWPVISDVVKTAWDLVSGVIATATKVALDVIGTFLDLLTGHWGKAWDSLKQTVSDAWNGVTGLIGSLVGDALNLMVDIGKDIINGLVQGIKSMAEAPLNAVKGIVSDIPGAAKSILKIFSPSKVMHEIGVNVSQGLADGINAGASNVAAAAHAVTNAAAGPISSLGAGTGTYSPSASATSTTRTRKAKVDDPMADAISALRDREKELSVTISEAVNGTTAQQSAAVKAAQAILAQAAAAEKAAAGTKDHAAAVTAFTAAEKARDTAVKNASGASRITQLGLAQTRLNNRITDAPNTGSTVASATTALGYDDRSVKAAQNLLREADSAAKAAKNSKDHTAALKEVDAAQQSLTRAQEAARAAQQALSVAQQQARQDAVDLANAQSALTVIGASPLAQAQEKLAEAQRQLGIDTAGTTQFFKDQASVMQDVIDVATAASDAQQQAMQDSVDLANAQLEAAADPGNAAQQAQNKVTEAMNQLAIDAQGTTKWYTDQAALNQATYAQTQAALSATTALNSLADASQIVTNLPSYLATVQATSSSYVQPGYVSNGSQSGGDVHVHLEGSTIVGAGSIDSVAQALTPSIRAALNTTQRRAGQPLLAG